MRFYVFFLLALSSCSSPFLGKDYFGADEFVLDSYKIREGEFSMELDESMLEECPEKHTQVVRLAGMVSATSVRVDGKTRLFDVLSFAKIPPDANLFKSYVIRCDAILPVDLNKLMREGDMSQNIVMKGGDKIYIADQAAASLMVMGEVGKQQVIHLPSGYITLRQALAEVGGIPYTGDKSYIQVIRGSLAKPKIYTLSWEHIIHLPNESLLLMSGDIVYVAAKPITEWGRFFSQLIPFFGRSS